MSSVVKMNFDVEVAKELNVNAAIILSNIQYWVFINANKQRNKKDGKYWTYNTYEQYQQFFSWLTAKQIKDQIRKLEDAGYLESAVYNSDKRNRTKWYTTSDLYTVLPTLTKKDDATDDSVLCEQTKSSYSTDDSVLCNNKEHIINTDNKPYISDTSISHIQVNNLEVVKPEDVTAMPMDYLKKYAPSLLESALMKAPRYVRNDWKRLENHFNSVVLTDAIPFESKRLYGRLIGLVNNWKQSDNAVSRPARKLLA